MNISKRIMVVLGAAVLMSGAVTAGESKDYSGMARLVSVKSVMPLANGDGVIMARASGMATLSTTPPALFSVKCAGLGVTGVNDDRPTEFLCTFVEDEDNGFDVVGSQGPDGGSADLIGGNGRWQGAAGKVQFKRQSIDGDVTTVTFEMTAETP